MKSFEKSAIYASLQVIFRLFALLSIIFPPLGIGAVSYAHDDRTISPAANSAVLTDRDTSVDANLRDIPVNPASGAALEPAGKVPFPVNLNLETPLFNNRPAESIGDFTGVLPIFIESKFKNDPPKENLDGESQFITSQPLPASCTENWPGALICDGSPGRDPDEGVPPAFLSTLRGTAIPAAGQRAADDTLAMITVDTTDMTADGDVSSVAALTADPGEDGMISFLEALAAVNNTGSGHTINFNLPPDSTIVYGYTLYLMVSNTTIDGDKNSDGVPDVLLDGPNGYISLSITSDNNQIRSLAITGLNLEGASAHSNMISNCIIGASLEGDDARSENVNGIQIINNAHDNTIEHNLIAGNTFSDADKGAAGLIFNLGAHDNVVIDNRIGINWSGDIISNEYGIVIFGGSSKNRIGGELPDPECTDPCNLISGNDMTGVEISGKGTRENEVLGNFIGAGQAGEAAKPNGLEGIRIANGASNNTIGGTRGSTSECRGPCNLLSGNSTNGVLITGRGTDYNQVMGNFIGVKANGVGALPNGGTGVLIEEHAMANSIGGKKPVDSECGGPCNLISGNTLTGVGILGPDCGGNRIQGNFIGTDKDGSPVNSIGNKSVGVGVIDASDTQIGGGDAGEGNRIMDNAEEGVYIARTESSTDAVNHNLIRRNGIYSNGGPAIDLFPDEGIGVDGPNDNRLPPAIYPVRTTQTGNTIYGTSTAPNGSVVDIYEGGGNNYLGSAIINGGGFELAVTGDGALSKPIVGTVSDTDNNTSEFSAYGELTLGSPYALPGGMIYVFGVITQTQNSQPLLNSEDITITLNSESYPLRGDGKGADFIKDSYYSAWITAPLTLGDYEIVLTVNETPAAVTTFHVTDKPQLLVLTDLQELKNEFIRTSNRTEVMNICPALKRLSEYAGKYQGVLIDLKQEVKSTSVTIPKPYNEYFYDTGGIWDREYMVIAIDNYIHSLEPYKDTLKYMVIVGDDAVVPSFRRHDPFKKEYAYPWETPQKISLNNTLYDSGRQFILSDIPYGSFDNTDPNSVNKPPNPDLAVGRIFFATPKALKEGIDAFEKPIDVRPAFSTAAGLYIKNDTKRENNRVVITLTWVENFVKAIKSVMDRYFTPIKQNTGVSEITNPALGRFYYYNGVVNTWYSAVVVDAIEKTNLTVLYAHADQFQSFTEYNDAFEATDLAAIPLQDGSIFINAGCHSGYPVSRPSPPGANYYSKSFATTFLNHHIALLAPTTYGYGENNDLQFHDRLFNYFLLQIFQGNSSTIGEAYKNAQIRYNTMRTGREWETLDTYIRYGIAFYGLPTQCFQGRCPANPAGREPGPGSAAPGREPGTPQTAHTLDMIVETPNFQRVDSDAGARFELPNNGGLGGVSHYPLLPQVVHNYWLPAGSTITSVALVDQDSYLEPGPVTLETLTPVNRTFGPEPGREPITQAYPSQIYWYNTAEMDGSVNLVVGVNPLQYDPGTEQVTLFTRVELQVQYTAPEPTAGITGVDINNGSDVALSMDSCPITLTIESTQPQTVTLQWEINDMAGAAMGYGQESVDLAAGVNVVNINPNTGGWHPGAMLLTAGLWVQNTAIDTAAADFKAQGNSLAAATDKPFYNQEITATLTVPIYDQDGAGVAGMAAALTATLDGVSIYPTFTEVEPGRYRAAIDMAGLDEGPHSVIVGLDPNTAPVDLIIDHQPPTASLDPLPAGTAALALPIHWSGSDEGAGIDFYEVQYRVGNSPAWTAWFTASAGLDFLPSRSSAFFGPNVPVPVEYDQNYAFRIRAIDLAGNVGDYSDAISTVALENPPVERAEAIARVVELTNEQRVLNGLPPLKLVDLLNNSAQGHSLDMAANQLYEHQGSDGSYPEDRIYRAGYDWMTAGENVAVGQRSPEQVVDEWMHSPPHRANILNPDYVEIGIGYAFDPASVIPGTTTGYHYWVQNFGAREDVYPVVINDEAEIAASPEVSLDIFGKDWAAEMMISNDPDFNGASWQPFAGVVPWTLEAGQGVRTVYVRLRNNTETRGAAGSDYLESSDDIILGCCAVRGADLSVEKTASPETVLVGESVTFTVLIRNDGPSLAENVLLVDSIPSELETEAYHISQGFCTQWLGTMTCDIGEIENGSSITLTLQMLAGETSGGTVINSVEVYSTTPDPDQGNNSDSAGAAIKGGRADLAVSKQDLSDPVSLGSPIVYTITVTNNGPATADTVFLTDTLPTNVVFGSAAGTGWACNETSGIVTCTYGNLGHGGTAIFNVVVTPNETGVYTNSVTAGLDNIYDPDPANNADAEATAVVEYIIVNYFSDGADTNPGDGICDDGYGHCTLRAAIQEANAQAGLDYIAFNIPGRGIQAIQPVSPLPAITDPVVIDGATEPGYAGTPVVEVDGVFAGASTDGLVISAGGSTIKGLAINRFSGRGIFMSTNGGNTIENNYIGIDLTGNADKGNSSYGIHVQYTSNNVIGPDNVISGNNSTGIYLEGTGAAGNIVDGNKIGTNAAGSAAVGNSGNGILTGYGSGSFFRGGGSGYTISNNLISGNSGKGIYLTGSECLIEGNKIGTDQNGSLDLGNTSNGIYLGVDSDFGSGDIISNTIWNNLVSGNNHHGILLDAKRGQVRGNIIQGNLIGVDAGGTGKIGNSGDGINLFGYSQYCTQNTIGGTDAASRNLISGNNSDGIELYREKVTENLVLGNYIGVDIHGTGDLGNTYHGVKIDRAANNSIGGMDAGSGNTIAYNGWDGIALTNYDVTTGNRILSNSIANNDGLGIDLGDNGVTANDPGDADSGPNTLQNYPLITLAAPGSTVIAGTMESTPNTLYTLQFFKNSACDPSGYGEGETLFGSIQVTTNQDGAADFSIEFDTDAALGEFISAIAADPDGNSSEFSPCAEVRNWVDLKVAKTDDPDPIYAGKTLTYTIAVTNSSPTAATALELTDSLPTGALFTSAAGAGWSCAESGGSVNCTSSSLPAHQSSLLTVVVTPTTPGTITNTVTVTAGEPEAVPQDNTAVQTTVVDPADLSLGMSDSPDPAIFPLTYTIAITNNGPLDATNLTLVDTLPGGVHFGQAGGTGWDCNESGGIVTCTRPDLPISQSTQVTIIVTPAVLGTITNRAVVSADQGDPDEENNHANEETTINPATDLVVIKSAEPDPVRLGEPISYTIVVSNKGPRPATGVWLQDDLPSEVSYQWSSAPGGCAESGGIVDCELGTLDAGGRAVVSITAIAGTLTPGVDDVVINTAAASGSETEADPVDNNILIGAEVRLPADDYWDSRFSLPGIPVYQSSYSPKGSTVSAIAFGPAGEVFAAGIFPAAGGTKANDVAMWDGSGWSALGLGIQSTKDHAIAVNQSTGEVYVGGWFTEAGGVEARNIARWDGRRWSALGSGVGSGAFDRVLAIAIGPDGEVYVGGDFTGAGETGAHYIAKWDGRNWSQVGSGVNGPVYAILVDGSGSLYAGGDFSTAGGMTAQKIARWDGSEWSPLGGGFNGRVYTLVIHQGSGLLCAGGSFTSANGATLNANRIACWDGAAWSALGAGIDSPSSFINSAAFLGDDLIVSGRFSTAGGLTAKNIARWDGQAWSEVGGGIEWSAGSSETYLGVVAGVQGDTLYAGGDFRFIGDQGLSGIARFNGAEWSPLVESNGGQGVNYLGIQALTLDDEGILYAGGRFEAAGGVKANNIARWNGAEWSPIGSGIGTSSVDEVDTLIVARNGDLYAGGYFFISGVPGARSIARWDGSSWSALGGGMHSRSVYAIAEDEATGDIYAGGDYTYADDVLVNHIARWDGESWSALGSGVSHPVWPRVFAIKAIPGGGIYVGGQFDHVNGIPANYIARWDGSSWTALGDGVAGDQYCHIHAIALAENGDLYVGGLFNTAGGQPASNIARWDGSDWRSLGIGVDSNVREIIVHGNDVFVSGSFHTAGGLPANGIAKWDGSSWSSLGSGLWLIDEYYDSVGSGASMALSGSDLYVGGSFSRAGRKPSNSIALWHIPGFDLKLAKTASSNPSVVGEALTYTLEVANIGITPATNLVLTDTLPQDVLFGSAAGPGWSCHEPSGLVTCTRPALEVAQHSKITIVVTPTVVGAITNNAQVSSNEQDGYPSNNFASSETAIIAETDLAVTVADHPDPVWVGYPLTYTVKVSNDGPRTATGVSLVDTLPDQVSFQSGEAPSGCSAIGSTVTCSLGNIESGGAVTATIHAMVNSITAEIDAYSLNTASVSANETDADLSDNHAQAWTGIRLEADEHWDPRFSTPGAPVYIINTHPHPSTLSAMAFTNDGGMVVAGAFKDVGGTKANGIALWENGRWSALGSGVTTNKDMVLAVDRANGAIYLGGQFTQVGNTTARNIARWDGRGWSALGAGVGLGASDQVRAAAVSSGGNLFVGGDFSFAGAVGANNVAGWDGKDWYDLDGGVNGSVRAIAAGQDGDVYVGGTFTSAGGQAANYIARWDGEQWSTLGGGVNGPVLAIAVNKESGEVCVGGRFTSVGSEALSAKNVACWDGSDWTALGSGVGSGDTEQVHSMAFQENDLVVCGRFTVAGGSAAKNLARWDGANWSEIGGGVIIYYDAWQTPLGIVLGVQGSGLFVGGDFLTIGGMGISGIARWDGEEWNPVVETAGGLGVTNPGNSGILGFAVGPAGELYAGGNFWRAGEVNTTNIARWDGTNWSPLGSGIGSAGSYPVWSVAADKTGNVYAAGYFWDNGMNSIAKWDGADWSAMGSGMYQKDVFSLAVDDERGLVYAGGIFDTAGGVPAKNIAVWDGNEWSALGAGVTGAVYDIVVAENGDVYVGGLLATAGGESANRVARWDGSQWHALGGGLTNSGYCAVYALALAGNGDLYAGGQFSQAGSVGAKNIARWDGANWYPLGSGTSDLVSELLVWDDTIVAGGYFQTAGGVTVNGVARWNSSSWSAFGSGAWYKSVSSDTKTSVGALATIGNDLYIGGDLTRAGRKPSFGIGLWHEPSPDLVLSKVGAPDPLLAGETLTYTLAVTNTGNLAATNLLLTDTLPAGVTFGNAGGEDWICGYTAGQVTCALPSLPIAHSSQVTIVVTPATAGVITNTAGISAIEYDSNPVDNHARASTYVSPADLQVGEQTIDGPSMVAYPLTITLAITNNGPANAHNLVLTDNLPSGVSFSRAFGVGWACAESEQTVVCTLLQLPALQTVSVSIVVTPTQAVEITNYAEVWAGEPDMDETNNTTSATLTIEPFFADFSDGIPPGWVVVDGGDGTGGAATWTTENPCSRAMRAPLDDPWLMVDSDCAGQGDTQDEQLLSPVFDTTGCTYVAFEFSNQFRSFSGNEIGDVDVSTNGGLDWINVLRFMGSSDGYPAPAPRLLDLTELAAGKQMQIRFYYTNAHFDWWWAIDNLRLTCLTTPIEQADLSLGKQDTQDPIYAGQSYTYTLIITNNGPSAATGVTLVDDLPDLLVLGATHSSQGNCLETAPSELTCDIGELLDQTQVTITILVTPTQAGIITNTAVVTANEADPDGENNTARVSTTVEPSADLGVTKIDLDDPVVEGESLAYLITVSNYGPSPATGVNLVDTLPGNVDFKSAVPGQGECFDPAAGEIYCDLGPLSDGDSATVTIIVTPTLESEIANSVQVDSNEFDPEPSNNQAQVSTTIQASQFMLYLPLVVRQVSN